MAGKNPNERFISTVERLDSGLRFHVLPIPEAVAARWKAEKVRRVVGTINGHRVNRGLQHHADGGAFIILGRDLLDEIGLKLRSAAKLELGPDPAPEQLVIPEELSLALEQDDAARTRWDTFTVGRRRSLIHYVTNAKLEPTRIKRALDLAEKIRTCRLYGDIRSV